MMTLACVFVANYCKSSRRYGLNGRCPFFRVLSILTAISPAQMTRNRRIKPWSSENEKKEERAHRPREFQTVDNQIFIVTKPRFQGLCGGVIQNGEQLPLRKDPGNEEGPSVLGAYHFAKKSGNFALRSNERQFSGKSFRKLWTTSRGSPLFPFGTEFAKCSYHLRESFRFQATEKIE